jgi:hypothetical protein
MGLFGRSSSSSGNSSNNNQKKDEKKGEAEHTKGKRPSTQEQHQTGQSRKKKDQGGEKGDARRRPNPNTANGRAQIAAQKKAEKKQGRGRG